MRALNCEVAAQWVQILFFGLYRMHVHSIEMISWPVLPLCSPLVPTAFFTAEFLFLLWAVYLCYAVRTVPSAFHEPRYMAIAVHNELILTAIFYVIR